MQKRTILLIAVIAILLGAAAFLFYPRANVGFDGDRIRNTAPERFSLRFSVMNTDDTEIMPLREGDALRISWNIESGSVDLTVSMKGEEPIYRANGRGKGDNADFVLSIPQTGNYVLSVSGRQARGTIEFIQVEPDAK